jgi:hypothetical protein
MLLSTGGLYLLHGPVVVGLDGRVARVTLVEPIGKVEDDVVADEPDLGVVVLSRLDVDTLKGELFAGEVLGAVDPDDTVASRRSGEVLKVNIGPSAGKFLVAVQKEGICTHSKLEGAMCGWPLTSGR